VREIFTLLPDGTNLFHFPNSSFLPSLARSSFDDEMKTTTNDNVVVDIGGGCVHNKQASKKLTNFPFFNAFQDEERKKQEKDRRAREERN